MEALYLIQGLEPRLQIVQFAAELAILSALWPCSEFNYGVPFRMWKLAVLNAVVSLVSAGLVVLAVQFIFLNLGVPETVTNPVALVLGLGTIVGAEWLVRRWWARTH